MDVGAVEKGFVMLVNVMVRVCEGMVDVEELMLVS